MISSFTTFGVRTPLIHEGDDLAGILIESAKRSGAGGFSGDDILVLAETALATAEGNVTRLDSVIPDRESRDLAVRYAMDPRVAEVVRRESDAVVGGIPGFLLCMKHGTLLPNAGIDASNAPPGCVVPL
ncbi:MAG: coenzyme F420-0:L-glutamate ligase, partial [Methanolinea sp.]|nr:coenzyme F420-0:L-glutamate ligase [Methanolinea sp.]